MMNSKMLRIYLPAVLALLLTACGSIERTDTGSVGVPVEERDHGPISTYRIVPPPPASQDEESPQGQQEQAPTGSAVSHLHADARKQLAARQYNTAASTLERALRIAPRNADLWHSLAEVRLQQGRWEMARNMAAKSNSFAAANRAIQAQNWRIIAKSHQAEGNQVAARRAWQRVSELEGG